MKLHRLRVQSFAAIREIEIAFGPGLNVLYGPNELGKSTLADAIRLVLLLPYTSTHYEPYVPWSGADDPFVDLTFEMEAQRIWRVQKQFGKRGSARLQESRNGQDFDDVERARRVDAKLREILRWGIPEPGGPGAGKGLPTSFLATALLSTQANVTDVLHGSLHDDPTATGKDQIAEALQAVAQDPLFVALLREAQARRDEAYTDKGAKKTARGSVFKDAADRVREAREEKERFQKIVEDSEDVERELRDLAEQRERCDHELAAAAESLEAMRRLAQQAAARTAAEENARAAREEVARIRKMDRDVADAEERVRGFAGVKSRAEQALADAQEAQAAAGEALATAEETVQETLSRCDLLERAAEARAAEKQAAAARVAVEREAALQVEHARISAERHALAERRAALVVPPPGSLAALRKLATELAGAQGALDVGLVMTVIPTAIIPLRVRTDGIAADPGVVAQPLEIEANSEVEVDVADLATIRVRGGRRAAQERVRVLESRWEVEAVPHLTAAGAVDLDALEARIAEARDLESGLQSLDGDLRSLQRQIADLAGAAEALEEASARAEAFHRELEDVALATLIPDLDALGSDPGTVLRSRRQQAAKEVDAARKTVQEAAARSVDASRGIHTTLTDHASEEGRLAEIRRLREAVDLAAAENRLREATERKDALPAPERWVTPEEVAAAEEALEATQKRLKTLDREIHITQGRLQQVGGAVARERLRDALEAFELAERHEREIEADYEAWRLLLEQMKEADAEQASNLGQAFAPAIAGRFAALTQQRYQNIQLTAHLGTEGVIAAGAVRSPDQLSVGTREQLSTLYRLCLGEYLQTTIVLDDQLVQSDDTRMEWFRKLLAEKARGFQIVVFTCRPGDYLDPAAMVGEEGTAYADSEEGFVRAIDLERVGKLPGR